MPPLHRSGWLADERLTKKNARWSDFKKNQRTCRDNYCEYGTNLAMSLQKHVGTDADKKGGQDW